MEVGGGGRREIYRVEVGGLQMDGINIWRFFLSHSVADNPRGIHEVGIVSATGFPLSVTIPRP